MTEPSMTSTHHRVALVTLLLASTLGVMAGAIVMPVLEVIRGDFGVDGTAAGLIITSHGLAIAVSSPIIGRLIDRWGVRRPLGAGLLLYGLGGGAGSVVTSYPELIASRLLLGLGAAFVFSGTTVALLGLYQGHVRDRIMGWRTTATTLGGVLWPLLAGMLGEVGWNAAFTIYLVGVPLGCAVLFTLPRELDQPKRQTESSRRDGHHSGALALMRRHPTLLSWYALMTLSGLLLYSLAVFLPQRLAQLDVENPWQVSLFMAANAGAAGLVGLVYAPLRARANDAGLLRTTALLWTMAFLFLGAAQHPALLAPGAALFGLGNGLMLPTITMLIGDTPPPDRRGQATSLSGTAAFVGQFSSPLVFGPIMEETSIGTGYLLVAGVSAALTVALILVPRARITTASANQAAHRPDRNPAGAGPARE